MTLTLICRPGEEHEVRQHCLNFKRIAHCLNFKRIAQHPTTKVAQIRIKHAKFIYIFFFGGGGGKFKLGGEKHGPRPSVIRNEALLPRRSSAFALVVHVQRKAYNITVATSQARLYHDSPAPALQSWMTIQLIPHQMKNFFATLARRSCSLDNY